MGRQRSTCSTYYLPSHAGHPAKPILQLFLCTQEVDRSGWLVVRAEGRSRTPGLPVRRDLGAVGAGASPTDDVPLTGLLVPSAERRPLTLESEGGGAVAVLSLADPGDHVDHADQLVLGAVGRFVSGSAARKGRACAASVLGTLR